MWRHNHRPLYLLFAQLFVQAQINENIEAPRFWPLWGESTGDRWPFDDIIMNNGNILYFRCDCGNKMDEPIYLLV